MRPVDAWLQDWRFRRAEPWVPAGSRLLDIGSHQGEFLERLGDRIGSGMGIDPLAIPRNGTRYQLRRCSTDECGALPASEFDVITMLAVVEHIPERDQLIEECHRLLVPGGRVVLTVPAPVVDHILVWLVRLRVVDGMSLDEHHGFDPRQLPGLFARHGFALDRWDRFQLGLNNLMVFRRG
jgi:2-polyprenyl-3-methyl-5-hydroxy-6-metoxy-1,4-benzoquinol methylase